MDPPSTSTGYRSTIKVFNSLGQGTDHRISMVRVRGHLVLRLEGAVSRPTALPLVEAIRPLLANPSTRDLVVDLTLCEQVNSAIIGLIAFATMELAKTGRKVSLARPTPAVRSMLKVLGADRTMTVFDSVDEAIGD